MGLRGIGANKVRVQRKDSGFRIKDDLSKPLAERVIMFIESLPVTSGVLAGYPTKLLSWQKKAIRAIYRTNKRGQRIVRQALITIPRKNGKTAMAARLALASLCGPAAEQRGEIYSAAANRDQASLIFNEMKAIINEMPELQKRIIIRDFNKHLEDVETGSIYHALSADANTKHGFSASFVIYDELAQAPNRLLYDVLRTSGGARKEPLMIVISTQSPDPESVMTELVDYGLRVQNGLKDRSFYSLIYTAPDDADPWDEGTWQRCNPSLGKFRTIDDMRTEALRAQRIPAQEAQFRQLYLNQRINAEARLIDMADWDQCGGPVDLESLKGKTCYAGMDLAFTTDIAALVIVFPVNGQFHVVPFFWIPEAMDKRTDAEKQQLRVWLSRKLMTATPGNIIDFDYILATIERIQKDFNLRWLASDEFGGTQLFNSLQKNLGFTVDKEEAAQKPFLYRVRQDNRGLSNGTKSLLNAILTRKLVHGGHPILKDMANNCIAKIDDQNRIKPAKATEAARIDGIVALVMGLDAAMQNGNDTGRSKYESESLQFL